MSISNSEWTASSPQFQQPDVDIDIAVTFEGTTSRECTGSVQNALNCIHDDPDVQEVFFRLNSSPYNRAGLDAFELVSGDYASPSDEFQSDLRTQAGSSVYYVQPVFIASDDTGSIDFRARYKNSAKSGADTCVLGIKTAYHWANCTPPQIAMDMLHHYLPNTYSLSGGLRDYMDQDTWQAASDDYFDYRTDWLAAGGYSMTCWREVGSTIKEQVEKIIHQTADFVGVRPGASTGIASLHWIKRELANEVTTPIDLDDPDEGVRMWTGGVDEQYQIDGFEFEYGQFGTAIKHSGSTYNQWINWIDDLYRPQHSSPPDLEHEGWRRYHIRKHSGQYAELDLPYVLYGYEIARHWHLYWYVWEQQDLLIEHGPRHFNYEVGDLVHIKSEKLGLDGSEWFVVYEKDCDYSSLHSKTRVLRVYGYDGVRPDRLNVLSANTLQWWHRSEALGVQPDGLPAMLFSTGWQPRLLLDRTWPDDSGLTRYSAVIGSSSTSGTGIVRRSDHADSVNGWLTLDVGDPYDAFTHEYDETSTADLCLVMLVKHKTGTFSADEVLWFSSNGGGADFIIYLHDATHNGAGITAAGANAGTSSQPLDDTDWHILEVYIYSGTTAEFYEDGVLVATVSLSGAPAAGADSFWMALTGTGGLNCEVVVAEGFWLQDTGVGAPFSGTDRADYRAYLEEKYRLSEL